jgi:hypothetical protein
MTERKRREKVLRKLKKQLVQLKCGRSEGRAARPRDKYSPGMDRTMQLTFF